MPPNLNCWCWSYSVAAAGDVVVGVVAAKYDDDDDADGVARPDGDAVARSLADESNVADDDDGDVGALR